MKITKSLNHEDKEKTKLKAESHEKGSFVSARWK